MASISRFHSLFPTNSIKKFTQASFCSSNGGTAFLGSTAISSPRGIQRARERKQLTVVAAVGDVSAGAVAVALHGTAFPIFFSRKDTCPECDGAGFVRKGGATLRANAARKDQAQIVCARCDGLGKLNQIDK